MSSDLSGGQEATETETAPSGREVFDGASGRTKALVGTVAALAAFGALVTGVLKWRAARRVRS